MHGSLCDHARLDPLPVEASATLPSAPRPAAHQWQLAADRVGKQRRQPILREADRHARAIGRLSTPSHASTLSRQHGSPRPHLNPG